MADMQIVLAGRNVEPQYVEMMVPLYSYGCERKVKKALSHIKGIYSVKVDFEQQKVTVWGICNKYDVLVTVKSKRKDARFWNAKDNIGLMQESETASDSSSTPPSGHRFRASAAPPLALLRTQSLSWRALKKAFTRTYSF